MKQNQTSRVSDRGVTYDDFVKLTGGSLITAYELMAGYYGAVQRSIQTQRLIRTCPKCGGRMLFRALDPAQNPKHYTGVWSCIDEYVEPDVDQCTYEEFVTDDHATVLKMFGVVIPHDAPLIDLEEQESGRIGKPTAGADYLYELKLAGIYQRQPRKSEFAQWLPDWVRRRCPQCGGALVFYPTHDNKAGKTGVFACPSGWESEFPDDWCGYEEVVDAPIEELFTEYYRRAVTRQDACRQLLMKSCPLCGNRLYPRPIEENASGWKTRWICTSGFQQDDPDGLCGYEELSKETIGSYIKQLNKMIAEG